MAPIVVGDLIPNGTLSFLDENDEHQQVSVHSLTSGKKVFIIGVLGTFIPLLGTDIVRIFIEGAEQMKSKGIDEILLVSVNDKFVMKAWEKTTYPENKHVRFLVDSSATYVHALGLQLDYAGEQLGRRSRNFFLLVDNLKVQVAKAIVHPNRLNHTNLGSMRGRSRGRGNRVRFQCHHCGNIGHTIDRCYRLHGYPSTSTNINIDIDSLLEKYLPQL